MVIQRSSGDRNTGLLSMQKVLDTDVSFAYGIIPCALRKPALTRLKAAPEFLSWHNENVFRE
jgi:hypothetical protein